MRAPRDPLPTCADAEHGPWGVLVESMDTRLNALGNTMLEVKASVARIEATLEVRGKMLTEATGGRRYWATTLLSAVAVVVALWARLHG